MTSHTNLRLLNARRKSAKACSIESVCVTTSILCLFALSIKTPAKGVIKKEGIWLQNATAPKINTEFVSLYTNQLIATVCIQVPTSETSCPLKKRRKFLWRRERKTSFNLLGVKPPRTLSPLGFLPDSRILLHAFIPRA
jgi:hypothetical protein